MKKILTFCLLCSFVFGGVANVKGNWNGELILNGEKVVCNGKKEYYSSSGAGATYGFNNGLDMCLFSDDKDKAYWLISYEDNNGVFGENCKFIKGDSWICETKKEIKMENVEYKSDEIQKDNGDIEFFDEDEIFGTGRFYIK